MVNGLALLVPDVGPGAAKRRQCVCKTYGTNRGLGREPTRCGAEVNERYRRMNINAGLMGVDFGGVAKDGWVPFVDTSRRCDWKGLANA